MKQTLLLKDGDWRECSFCGRNHVDMRYSRLLQENKCREDFRIMIDKVIADEQLKRHMAATR